MTRREFEALQTGVQELVNMIKEDRAKPSNTPVPLVPETPLEKEVRKAGPDPITATPPDWDEKAREILGEALDHCEMTYGASGGVRFSLIIKPEHSNAPKDYLKYYGQDRRTKDVGSEGIQGVENWCKLVKQNLGTKR